MYQVKNITSDPLQKQVLVLADGSSVDFTIKFVPMQVGWFIQELVYLNFTLQGYRLVNSPNMLHQFRNQIPFGLACYSTFDREPSLAEDFSSAASILYILTAAEVAQYAGYLSD